MRAVLYQITRIATVINIALMTVMLVVVNATVVTRYVFSYSPPWKEELTCYSMVWMVMLAAGILALFDDHIALFLAVEKLPKKGLFWQGLVSKGVVAFSGVMIAWTGFNYTASMLNVTATGLRISMFWPVLAVPVGASMMAVFATILFVNDISGKLGGPKVQIPDQAVFMNSSFRSED